MMIIKSMNGYVYDEMALQRHINIHSFIDVPLLDQGNILQELNKILQVLINHDLCMVDIFIYSRGAVM